MAEDLFDEFGISDQLSGGDLFDEFGIKDVQPIANQPPAERSAVGMPMPPSDSSAEIGLQNIQMGEGGAFEAGFAAKERTKENFGLGTRGFNAASEGLIGALTNRPEVAGRTLPSVHDLADAPFRLARGAVKAADYAADSLLDHARNSTNAARESLKQSKEILGKVYDKATDALTPVRDFAEGALSKHPPRQEFADQINKIQAGISSGGTLTEKDLEKINHFNRMYPGKISPEWMATFQQQREALAPPVPGARQAPDGNWYVFHDGKFIRIDR